MIREYALEPTLLSTWESFRYFTEKFSVPQGKLISQFPENWKKRVYSACSGTPDIEKKRIVERLTTCGTKFIKRTRPFDPEQSWIENAIVAHSQRPFHAVIAVKERPGCDCVLAGPTLDSDQPLWRDCHSATVKREAAALADTAAVLLEISDHVIFIDPYFKPDSHYDRMPLRAFLERIRGRAGELPRRIEFHCGDGAKGGKTPVLFNLFQADCRARLPGCVPVGMKVSVHRWKMGSLHNRFILTDRGAIQFGAGLDEATSTGMQYDQVTLLDEVVRVGLWDTYVEGKDPAMIPAGDLGPIIIEGRLKIV